MGGIITFWKGMSKGLLAG